jgi:hypothetical protein
MNAYQKTSKKTGGYRAMTTVRREYREAAKARQTAHQRLCDLYVSGKDTTKAKTAADAADREFWCVDHEFRRYAAFYA